MQTVQIRINYLLWAASSF